MVGVSPCLFLNDSALPPRVDGLLVPMTLTYFAFAG